MTGIVALLIVGAILFYVVLPVSYAQSVAHPVRSPVRTMPADLGLPYKDVSFKTADGLTLHGWYIPSQNGAAIIAAHGIGGNRTGCLELAQVLVQEGYGVLLFDLRAHGESEGDTTTYGGADVQAAAVYLKGQDDVDPDRIGAFGVSLGGLVVVQAAADSQDIRAVVADGAAPATFSDLPRPGILAHWLDLPFQWTTFQVWKHEGVNVSAVPITEAVAEIAPRPVLLISGARSRFERDLQLKIYAAAGEPKTLFEIAEAGHTGGWAAQPGEYREKVLTFFGQALLKSSGSD
jgi:pimeloyl-ACP methyl ester carboxylesterase